MSIYPSNFFSKNIVLNNKYLRCLNNRKLYLFILGLTLSIGDIKLILATSIFAGAMLISYQLKNICWRSYNQYYIKVLTQENKQLILSVITAGSLAIGSYIILNIWTEIDNKWLALGIIWQSLFSTLGIGFMGYKIWQKKPIKERQYLSKFNELINQLNDDSPLQRLKSINDIMELKQNNQLTSLQINQVKEYFILLLDLENEQIIINKLNQSLSKISTNSMQPLNIPQKVNQNIARKKIVTIK